MPLRRTITVLLATLFTSVGLVACGGDATSPENFEELVGYWFTEEPYQPVSPDRGEGFNALLVSGLRIDRVDSGGQLVGQFNQSVLGREVTRDPASADTDELVMTGVVRGAEVEFEVFFVQGPGDLDRLFTFEGTTPPDRSTIQGVLRYAEEFEEAVGWSVNPIPITLNRQ